MDDEGAIRRGNRIRITAGTFENFEAVVTAVNPDTGRISAEIVIFGKSTPVEIGPHEAERIPWQKGRE